VEPLLINEQASRFGADVDGMVSEPCRTGLILPASKGEARMGAW